ncbi:MAG: polynucleotide adenylyltransferase, partial [Clostridia bacterium]|nr:polynucleotide adenylyltransferase [Clostridia bacterium]
MQKFILPEYVTRVLDTLRGAGHRGYLVGGSLRDLLRGVTPHDYDMTTDALPDEMLEIFADFRVIPTGLKHGTLTVMSDGKAIELTTHRVDGAYADARHPDSVSFTRKLTGDLSRRDFTVNAMAWNPEVGLVDLFGGQADLQDRVLRTVGNPDARFGEDALRILRLFRFCAQLEFEIEENTLLAAARVAAGLAKISVERVFSEITRLLEAPCAEKGLAALFAAECEKYAFFDTVC